MCDKDASIVQTDTSKDTEIARHRIKSFIAFVLQARLTFR